MGEYTNLILLIINLLIILVFLVRFILFILIRSQPDIVFTLTTCEGTKTLRLTTAQAVAMLESLASEIDLLNLQYLPTEE